MNEDSGARCAGPVRAKFSGNTLLIDADHAPCSKGGGFYGHNVRCTQDGGNKAMCNGKEKGGKKNSWDAKFKRS